MKKKPLAYYLNLIKSLLDKQNPLGAKHYGEIALKKLPVLSYSPFEEYLLYCRLGDAYGWLAEYSRSLDICYKANLIASKHHLAPEHIAYTSYMIGSNLLSIRNINRALYQFQKVEKYYKEYGYESILMNKMLHFISLMGLGYCYMANNLEKTKEIIEEKLLPMSVSLKDDIAYGYYYHLKGEYLMLLKDYAKARECFQEYIKIYKRLNDSPDQVLEGEIHIATIDLMEGNLEFAIQSLESLFKEARHLKINDITCHIGFLLSKCYSLNNMPDKSIAVEKYIKPLLNKLDIVWLYEKNREFEQLYSQLQPIYSRYSPMVSRDPDQSVGTSGLHLVPHSTDSSIPQILTDTIWHHYELAGYRHTIIGQSAPMIEIYQFIGKIAPTDLPVLIQGETGTGKELIAQAIHQNSLRKGKSWLALNCGAVPETLLETELFGHSKGAFTDAREDRKGYIELTDWVK
jgi:tetratricopeptide (TPR) repeat protein